CSLQASTGVLITSWPTLTRHGTIHAARALLSFQSHRAPRDLHSFPTRRSSDLQHAAEALPGRREREDGGARHPRRSVRALVGLRSEEHTSELQSLTNLVCRLLLEKKNRGYAKLPTTTPSHTTGTPERADHDTRL